MAWIPNCPNCNKKLIIPPFPVFGREGLYKCPFGEHEFLFASVNHGADNPFLVADSMGVFEEEMGI